MLGAQRLSDYSGKILNVFIYFFILLNFLDSSGSWRFQVQTCAAAKDFPGVFPCKSALFHPLESWVTCNFHGRYWDKAFQPCISLLASQALVSSFLWIFVHPTLPWENWLCPEFHRELILVSTQGLTPPQPCQGCRILGTWG